MVKKLNEGLGDRVAIVYRSFPLEQIHDQAMLAAGAAEAAGQQDKFWEMHNKLYEEQGRWSGVGDAQALFIGYGQQLGLDLERFEDDMASDKTREKVEASYVEATSLKLRSTPSMFLNGEGIDLPRSYEELSDLIQEAYDKGA